MADALLASASLIAALLAAVALYQVTRLRKALGSPAHDGDAGNTVATYEQRLDRLDEITERLDTVVARLLGLEQASRDGLEVIQLTRAAKTRQGGAVRTRGAAGRASPTLSGTQAGRPDSTGADGSDEVADRLLGQMDQQTMSLEQVGEYVGRSGRRTATLVSDAAGNWLLIAVSAASGDGWLVVPRLYVAMGQVKLHQYFDLRNYNGVDPLRARDVGVCGRVGRTPSGWHVVSKGLIDVQAS